MKVTHDRGAIIDFIGKQHGSPALKKGTDEPVIVVGHETPAEVQKVGWPAFFKQVEGRKLALAYDLETGEHKWVPVGTRPEAPSPGEVSTGVGAHDKPHA